MLRSESAAWRKRTTARRNNVKTDKEEEMKKNQERMQLWSWFMVRIEIIPGILLYSAVWIADGIQQTDDKLKENTAGSCLSKIQKISTASLALTLQPLEKTLNHLQKHTRNYIIPSSPSPSLTFLCALVCVWKQECVLIHMTKKGRTRKGRDLKNVSGGLTDLTLHLRLNYRIPAGDVTQLAKTFLTCCITSVSSGLNDSCQCY